VNFATINLADNLKTFKAVSVGGPSALTARTFGTLTTTGLAAAGDLGDFRANLISTTPTTGVGVGAATVAGTLIGTWDIRGSVGTVKAARTSSWNLGTLAGANIHNGGQLTGATSLTLGVVIPATIHATGAVAALTASEITASAFTAGSWGMVKVTGNLGLGLIRDSRA